MDEKILGKLSYRKNIWNNNNIFNLKIIVDDDRGIFK
jgi:hypothetical protein